MKICVAQIIPHIGDIDNTIGKHVTLIDLAVSFGVDIIVFPEMSLTGYEPKLAKELAIKVAENRLDVFQTMSNKNHITIGVGAPIVTQSGIKIGMILFQPGKDRITYFKQYLHADERPWFIEGVHQVWLKVEDKTITPAICYESLLPKHLEAVMKKGTDIYMGSVAKSADGVKKAFEYFAEVAAKYSITVSMANSVGPCDNFTSAGNSAIWNREGELTDQLDETCEGILIMDINTGETNKHII